MSMADETLTHAELQERLERAEGVIAALRGGGVDAIVGQKNVTLLRLREVEAKLRQSESRYRALVDLSPHAIAVHADGKYVFVNPAAVRLFGATRAEEIIGRDVLSLVHPDDREAVAARMQMAAKDGLTTPTRPFKVLRLNGQAIDVEVSGGPIEFQEQRAVQVVLQDVTERKRAERLVRESQERARRDSAQVQALLDATPAIVWVARDRDCRNIVGNRAAAEFLRVSVGANMSKIGPAAADLLAHYRIFENNRELPLRELPIQRVARSGRPLNGCALDFVFADGTVRSLVGNVTPLLDVQGRPDGAIAAFVDITDRKRMEERLRQNEERLRLADLGGVGIWLLDVVSGHFDLSQRGCSIHGLSSQGKATVEQVLTNIHPEDRSYIESVIAEALENLGQFEGQYRVIHPDGSEHWVRAFCQTLPDKKGCPEVNIGVVIDITEQKTYESKLIALNDFLEQRVSERTARVEQQAKQLRALASQLSQAEQNERKRLSKMLHDHIQQLIVAARLQVDMQLEWLKGDTNSERLLSTVQAVDGILKEALEASRSLTVELSPPVLRETGLIGSLNWLASRMQEQHRFAVRMRADAAADPPNEATRFLLFECVREVLLNVVKHAGVREADITLMRLSDSEIKMVVRDRGKGFDPDVVKSRRTGEVGFGLFSIQERLAHLGGQMNIESAPGRGTLVTLVVPVAAEKLLTAKAEAATDRATRVRIRRKPDVCRLLIVDDHTIMREGLVRLFEFEMDIEVVGGAGDGVQAIELAKKLKPNVIIMDVNLGKGMDGVEATRRILANDPQIKVVSLSMHIDGEVANAMRDAGAVAYLTKGCPPSKLIEAIRTCHWGGTAACRAPFA
jgi:PAS domain S-box-containing protein